MSVIEAVRHGCLPLLPDRLSYPEIMPADAHSRILYGSPAEMVDKLADMLLKPAQYLKLRQRLALAMDAFSWENRIGFFDEQLAGMARPGGR